MRVDDTDFAALRKAGSVSPPRTTEAATLLGEEVGGKTTDGRTVPDQVARQVSAAMAKGSKTNPVKEDGKIDPRRLGLLDRLRRWSSWYFQGQGGTSAWDAAYLSAHSTTVLKLEESEGASVYHQIREPVYASPQG